MKTASLLTALAFTLPLAGAKAQQWSTNTLPSGLIAWWQAEGNMLDSAGSHHGAGSTAPSYAPGRYGQAFQFNGTDQSVSVPDSHADLDNWTQFTLEAWFNTDTVADSATPGAGRAFFSKVGNPNDHANYNQGYQFATWGNGTKITLAFNTSGQAWPGIATTAALGVPLVTNTWYHLVGTYDHNAVKIYLNGVLLTNNVVGPATLQNSTSTLRISKDDNFNVPFAGRVDDARIYNRALSAVEVNYLYQGPPTVIASTFDTDAEGWTVHQLSTLVTTYPRSVVAYENSTYHGSGGNPGGYLSTHDHTVNVEPHFVAPAKFLGDQSEFYGGVLGFDVQCNLTLYGNYNQVELIGNGHALFFSNWDIPGYAANTWTNWVVPLAPSDRWRLDDYVGGRPPTEEEFRAVLANLQELNINGDLGSGDDYGSIDNVRLSAPVATRLQAPQFGASQFTFSVPTVRGQSYTVQHNDDLATTNWVPDTSFIGNGGLWPLALPAGGPSQRFYRVRSP